MRDATGTITVLVDTPVPKNPVVCLSSTGTVGLLVVVGEEVVTVREWWGRTEEGCWEDIRIVATSITKRNNNNNNELHVHVFKMPNTCVHAPLKCTCTSSLSLLIYLRLMLSTMNSIHYNRKHNNH